MDRTTADDVQVSVIVEVTGVPFNALPTEAVEARAGGDVGESTVTVVAHQFVIAAGAGAHEHVHVAIVVEVAPCAGPALVAIRESQCGGHAGEGAITIVAHQDVHGIAAALGHKEIHVAVTVIIHPDAPIVAAASAELALPKGERTSAIVHIIDICAYIVAHEGVQIPVIVDIDHVAPLAEHILWKVLHHIIGAGAVRHQERNSAAITVLEVVVAVPVQIARRHAPCGRKLYVTCGIIMGRHTPKDLLLQDVDVRTGDRDHVVQKIPVHVHGTIAVP